MSDTRIVISLPADLVARARTYVRAGKAPSLGALVHEALEERLSRDELADILDAMGRQGVRPGPPAQS
jgi:hypothetical protein